ncbi:hypothetical protein RI129_008125 [Pyrocoelia pectoralis]|uniref:Molybdenum cofactor sulfurase n=1 Tax=Pyrocoelia pectoralis TaxID=417401 RepID=A0AAN7V9N3_9COLE
MARPEQGKVSYNNCVYTSEQEALISSEFLRLKDECYLEHAGATLYSEKQLSAVFSDFSLNTYGNPHASKLSEDVVDQIRYRILEHFHTNSDEYSVIFTSGATGALKLVGESFRFGDDGVFAYLSDNHTSVLGMREYAKNAVALSPSEAYEALSSPSHEEKGENRTSSLFVFPAQCNFSGGKYPLAWISKVHEGVLSDYCGAKPTKWYCMLDAAAYVSTNLLDLSKYKPDFICVSFYKLFGYPTGLGALLVKHSAAGVLEKKYFGGGTVLMALSLERVHVPKKQLHERFEDGTLPFLSIIALKHGFDTLQRLKLSMDNISCHTFSLARYVYSNLKLLRHSNRKPVAVLYHDSDFDSINSQGGIVNFNLLRPSGEYVGYAEVLHIANLFKVCLRTGCFCNPGACQRHLKLTTMDVKHHFKSGHVCGDQNDLIDGYPTGSVRISFGYMSTKRDADTFLSMIKECFVTISRTPILSCRTITTRTVPSNKRSSGVVEGIYVYPVKSCGAFKVNESWPIVHTGFKYDREWMIVNVTGVCITQKQDARLCMIKPEINLDSETLVLHYEGFEKVTLPLNMARNNRVSFLKCQSKVCGDRILGWDCGDEVGNWLSEVLGYPGLRLLKQCDDIKEINRSVNEEKASLSLTNQAQFLLINTASVEWLSDCIRTNYINTDDLIMRFRPNLVVAFQEPLVERKCSKVQVGNLTLNCDGHCTRCQMVCIDQKTGEKSPEPLKTLSKMFGGKISFGIYLSSLEIKQNFMNVNDVVELIT